MELFNGGEIAKKILSNLNKEQSSAVSTTDGPVLITAGPGTGKTHTLVQRAIYLLAMNKIAPENLFIATFTEKAAKELVTRITNELGKLNISVNVNDMYIGTFHSLCLRILKDNLEYTRLRKNYRLVDDFEQKYVVFQNIWRFRSIPDIKRLFPKNGAWDMSEKICAYVNNLSEELVSAEKLLNDDDDVISVLGEVMEIYQEILHEDNLMDFSSIQVEAYKLLKENPDILEHLRSKLTYIMVDEYQDTNYIQEQIVFLLAGDKHNICVVGDDDQGLYRFRGATIRNILEFPTKFSKGECKIISLTTNYRSNSDIVDFYNKWMQVTYGANFKFSWDKYRYAKRIVAHEQSKLTSSAVLKLTSKDDIDEWHQNILDFINNLKASGKLTDYNQIAFLFNSVKNDKVKNLADFLENHGINVYSPRSEMFFQRDEVRLALGCLMLVFPRYIQGLENDAYEFLYEKYKDYYVGCIKYANEYLEQENSEELCQWIRRTGKAHIRLKGNTDYAYSGLFYQLLEFQPFVGLLDTEMGTGVTDIRPARNLALLSQIIGKYEHLHRINTLSEKYIKKNTEKFFNLYLRLLIDGGIGEYEDDSEYAPSGCVSFLTIHQSKGMEFPIVVIGSLWAIARNQNNELMKKIEAKYFHRQLFEPLDRIKFFDFWRLFYTAFSRAQNLLVLTANENKRCPSKYFRDLYEELPTVDSNEFCLDEFNFQTVKDVNLKPMFSFTSHIAVYETCALQYKFYKELQFLPVRAGAMLFGTLVHETIEDIHRAALRHEESTITQKNISAWFNANYDSLSKLEHYYLADPQKEAALKQVQRYAERQNGNWSAIQQAEVDVSLVEPEYIIEGKIDLIKGEGDTVEIVDFKSEQKPDMEKMRDRIERYRRQLHIYAHLVEERTGKKVSKMHLYYTGEENSVPTISFPYTKTAIDGTMAAFDSTVKKIMHRDFSHCADDAKTCKNCDFRFYCKNK